MTDSIALPLGGPLMDGLVNFVTRMGTAGDKSAHSGYWLTGLDLLDLDAAYRTSIFRKICDIPPFDEVREWRSWKGLDEDQISALVETEERLGLRQKIAEARTLARKDGGAAILIGVNSGTTESPLNPEAIAKDGLKYLTVCTRLEITPAERNQDPRKGDLGTPGIYYLAGVSNLRVHPSRVLRFIGNPVRTPGFWDGWGESIWVELRKKVLESDEIAAAVSQLVAEAKVDIIKIKGLMSGLATAEYENLLVKRWSALNSFKSIANALLLDAEDEFESRTQTFAGLDAIQDRAMTLLAGIADIPATRLFGRAPQGMNATGDSDMRNYYDRIKAGQELYLQPTLKPLDEMIIRSALGDRPQEAKYEWNPLWQLSEKEAAEVEKMFADAATQYATNGTIPATALTEVVKGGLIERGQWPGAEAAYDEADAEGDVPDIEAEPTEAEEAEEAARVAVAQETVRNPAGPPQQRNRLAANDAAPRSLYVRRDVINQGDLKRWAKQQGFATTVDDMHVTLARSTAAVDWMKVGQEYAWSSDPDGKLTVPAGGPRLVDTLGRATVLLFSNTSLQWRWQDIRDKGAAWPYGDDFQPHITLTYDPGVLDLSKVEPYRGKIELGPEIFEEVQPLDVLEHAES